MEPVSAVLFIENWGFGLDLDLDLQVRTLALPILHVVSAIAYSSILST